jgi:predicted amidohydrolase
VGIRFAIYQGERPVGTPAALQDNRARLDELVREAKKYDIQLISFPELYLEGYTLTPELLQQLAEPVDGPSISRVAAIAKAHHISIICPYAERANDAFGYADGTEDPFRMSRAADFPVGILNCYEAEFPGLSRILALRGAKLIVIPTAADYYCSLPDGRQTQIPYPDVTHMLIPAHAYENRCFIAYCNRFGRERRGGHTWHYRGNSVLCGPHGDMVLAARLEETLLIADVVPGDYGPPHPEGHYLRNRRPELYAQLVVMQAAFDGGYEYNIPPE